MTDYIPFQESLLYLLGDFISFLTPFFLSFAVIFITLIFNIRFGFKITYWFWSFIFHTQDKYFGGTNYKGGH